MKKFLINVQIIVLLVTALPSFSQSLNFKPFAADKGLIDNYVYNIQQDDNGYLWLGTGEGLCRFDGFRFESVFMGDSLTNSIADKSYRDSKGRLWFGFRDGSVAVLENASFHVIRPDSQYVSTIAGFTETSKGEIIAATQDKGIMIIRDGYSVSYLTEGLKGLILSAVDLTPDGNLIAGTFSGLFLYRLDTDKPASELIGRYEKVPGTKILCVVHKPGDNRYWIGTEDEGLYLLQGQGISAISASVRKIGTNFGLEYSKVQKVYEDNQRDLWVCTNGEGVFKLISSSADTGFSQVIRYTDQNGMPSNFVSDIYRDIDGNYWFSTIGQGITALKDQAFTFYHFESLGFNDNILSLANDGNIYYLGGENGILVTDMSRRQADYIMDTKNGLPADKVTALCLDKTGYLWIGTSRSGIYRMKTGQRSASVVRYSRNSLENIISAIRENNDYIWVSTYGGVLKFSKDDLSFKLYTTQEKLPHNKIRDILVDSRKDVWIATRTRGLYNITKDTEISIDSKNEFEFVAITQDNEGQLWAATDGEGVFLFSKDSLYHFSTLNGMRSNYCYSIACDKVGNIWVGHRVGMSKIEHRNRLVIAYSVEQGITADFNPVAVITNSRNNLVFGTSKGIIEYNPDEDIKDTSPPRLNITGLKINDQDHDFTKEINLPYRVYRVRIDFIGINLKNPEGVKYQYKLDGYDDTWSEPSSMTSASFRLEDGRYTFVLRACDESGMCDEKALLKINIRIPVWKTWWFILLSFMTLVATVYIIIKVRERNQKLIQQYLQTELDARTSEVRHQAEVIENKNRDITDSINYAQRIQASILPPIKRLQDIFPGSFIFYQPRDIVSGDFYWYDRIWDQKFVIVCGDSTGHGVPGAFMSMIGTTLIKDICSRPGVRSPAEILRTLDIEIMNALNQNVEAEKSNDGMDIIVAEFDPRTKYLRVASAMRPLILYIDGEQIYVKGSRSSVGGKFEQEFEKEFINEEFQLSAGDLVYMFSDGYPDQFGGPLGKKFKMVRLKNLIRDIHDKSMEEQYNHVKNNFYLWKEDLEQVDDVLFMGIKI